MSDKEQNIEKLHMLAQNSLVVFDGYCMLCSRTVDFLLKADKGKKLSYAAVKFPESTSQTTSDDTVLYIENNKIYAHSEAIIRILYKTGGIYKSAIILLVFPKKFRDLIYNIIAKNRYRWFGRRQQCRMLPEAELNRFCTVSPEVMAEFLKAFKSQLNSI
jgi:predicted DCC family thiol-disulfide oxidoreductase YuxK